MATFAPGFGYSGETVTDFLNPLKPLLDTAWDVVALQGPDGIYAYVSAAADHGIQLVRFGASQTLLAGQTTNADVGGLDRPTELELVTIGDQTYLISASAPIISNEAPGTINVFRVDKTAGNTFGDLTLVDSFTSEVLLHGITDFSLAHVGLKTFIVGVSTYKNAIITMQLRADGTLGAPKVMTEATSPTAPLNGVMDVGCVSYAGKTYVVSASTGLDGLGLWQMSSTGRLKLVDTALPNADQGNPTVGVQPGSIHVVKNGVVALAFLYDTTTHSVLTYQIGDGELIFRSAVDLGGAFLNEAMVEIKSFTKGGHLFLVASNAGNSSVSLFSVEDDGSVHLLQSAFSGMTNPISSGSSYLHYTQGLDLIDVDGRIGVVVAAGGGGLSGAVNLLEVGNDQDGPNFHGTVEDDRFFNFASEVVAFGEGGHDRFYGGSRALDVYGGAGNDYYIGTVEDETAYGGTGSDSLNGGGGDDLIIGYNKASDTDDAGLDIGDSLTGGLGRDTMDGGAGNDTIYGGGGGDVIKGSTFDDLIFGGAGSDLIYAGSGNDTMDGGAGRDDFVFTTNLKNNHDRIDEFELAFDQIKFKGPDLNTFAGVFGASVQQGSDTVITLRPGHTVTLTGIDLDDLTAANFLFD